MKHSIFLNKKNWCKYNLDGNTLYYKGFKRNNIDTFLKKIIKIKSLKEATKYFNYLGENFAIILEKKKKFLQLQTKLDHFLYYIIIIIKSFFYLKIIKALKK